MEHLENLTFSRTNILHQKNGTKALSLILTNLLHLEYIELSHNALDSVQNAKEIADGIMRAKKLRIVNLSNSNLFGTLGLASILYNLSFSLNLEMINISRCAVSGNFGEVVESIQKMFRITNSLQYLVCDNIPNLNPQLNLDFFQALGEIRSLRYLDLSNSG